MALTRKQLAAMGIDAEKIDEIITSHTETVSGLKDEIARLKDDLATAKESADKLPGVQKELDDLKEQNKADAKAREGKDYDALKKEYDEYKAAQTAKETKAAKESALRGILSDLKITGKGADLAVKYTDFGGFELDKDGKIKDAGALMKALKEDWGDYTVKEKEKGAEEKNPPGAEKGGAGGMTKEQIMKIEDDTERQKAIMDNPGLFGLDEDD